MAPLAEAQVPVKATLKEKINNILNHRPCGWLQCGGGYGGGDAGGYGPNFGGGYGGGDAGAYGANFGGGYDGGDPGAYGA
ncbi:unnamed protein product, partial [Rotaria magnacalcarata]